MSLPRGSGLAGPQRLAKVRNSWALLRATLWFVPTLMGLAAFLLVALTVLGEKALAEASGEHSWALYTAEVADARAVLSTVLSSMITMASLVFSITMVVLTLAANQFGPRLIRNFMANPLTQIVLGTFVMTIIYCLLVFPTLSVRASGETLPFLSVSVALLLTILSTGLLVLFLHSLASSIVSETVIDRVGAELDALVEQLEPVGKGGSRRIVLPADLEGRSARMGTGSSGYVQAIRFEHLLQAAETSEALIVLHFRPGHYVVDGGREVAVYPAEALDERLAKRIRSAILTGAHRTPTQDLDFAIRHLDEIASRALSPGVNDPYTAVAVIDRLSASLCRLMEKALPDGAIRDDTGALRVVSTPPSYSGLLEASFNQIRQNGAGKPIIALHLLEAIGRVAEHSRTREQHDALAEQLEVITQAARRAVDAEFDRRRIDERSAAIQEGFRATLQESGRPLQADG